MSAFPIYLQQDQMDCGATCIRMISKYYKRNISISYLRKLTQTHIRGVNLLGISEASEKLGFRTQGTRLTMDDLQSVVLPCILHWQQNHFVVLFKIHHNKYHVADPAFGVRIFDKQEFIDNWYSHKGLYNGISLLLGPTPSFYDSEDLDTTVKIDSKSILQYFYSYKALILQLMLALVLGNLFQLLTPFLTQSIVDIGINTKDVNFIFLILIGQVFLFAAQLSVTFIRSWILLHISTRVNISMLTDFLIKLLKLPLSFFEVKTHGDILQRMNDQQRIETFLSGTALGTLFSLSNLVFLSIILAYYNSLIFFVFLVSTFLYIGWIYLFMGRREVLDKKRFALSSENQTFAVELIQSIQEIKLSNSEKQKRWRWEALQARLFKLTVANLKLSQYQQAGSSGINQLKSILITFISAKSVIDGNLTLGGMLAIQYIVGIASSPIEQLLLFFQQYQDAKISVERINDVYSETDEESGDLDYQSQLPNDKAITLKNVTFRYYGAGNDLALKNISIQIPEGKTTAIVGTSGSGKTTLLKLILRFYRPDDGEIYVGNTKLNEIAFHTWRDNCGTVMQDGYIFADTIENNIGLGDEDIDPTRLKDAIRLANLSSFIERQPFGLKTRIGTSGKGISQGQKQRILIARAVYKSPRFIFFDEATNALDSKNERIIIQNLQEFFAGRTVAIVAHRLSTVKHADNIIVLDEGSIVEQGTHRDLIAKKGYYYQLVKNQLELGN